MTLEEQIRQIITSDINDEKKIEMILSLIQNQDDYDHSYFEVWYNV